MTLDPAQQKALALAAILAIAGLATAVVWLARSLARARAAAVPAIDIAAVSDSLLKDHNHRFRNVLQTITSLLGLQRDSIRDQLVLREFESAIGRVGSITRFYQNQAAIKPGCDVPFDQIARGLLSDVQLKYDPSRSVALELDFSPLPLPLDRAIPLSVLLNEIATNASRHAFKGAGPSPHVTVRLTTGGNEGEAELTIADNGVGIAEPPSERLGLRIVKAFTRQLGGRVILHGNSDGNGGGGTIFSIVFRLEPPKSR